MTTLRTAAQQALEALQAHGSHAPNCDYLVLLTSLPPQRKPCSCGLGANITALRAALAEPVNAAMTREELDALLSQAMRQSLEEGENFVRYHFAALVAAEKDRKIEWLREALKMIAGESPCIDNLMSDKDIARAALRQEESK